MTLRFGSDAEAAVLRRTVTLCYLGRRTIAVARTLDRFGISERAGAAIVSVMLQDIGVIPISWCFPKMVTVGKNILKTVTLEKRLTIMRSERDGLHSSMRWTLICSRIMGFLPVCGIMHSSSNGLRVTLKSPYTLFYLITLVGQLILSSMSFYFLLTNGISLPNLSNTLFYVSSMITSLLLGRLGWTWPNFLVKVEEVESKLPPFQRNVGKFCKITTVVVLVLAMVEHVFSVAYGHAIAGVCNYRHMEEMYFKYYMPWIFEYIPYTIWNGILFEIFNIQSTFMWSYNDLLIMVLSIYLSEHFVSHYKLLKKALKRDHFSADIFRLQHLKIAYLVNAFNSQFGIYILTSFGTNVYWICTQLFYSLNKRNTGHIIAFDCDTAVLDKTLNGIEHLIYFAFSFSFLVARTVMVLLFAARVNSTSTSPLILLYDLPTAKYDVEVERFIDQMNNMKVAMSGFGFFFVTRTMILSLIGSIITYELVMLQFNK